MAIFLTLSPAARAFLWQREGQNVSGSQHASWRVTEPSAKVHELFCPKVARIAVDGSVGLHDVEDSLRCSKSYRMAAPLELRLYSFLHASTLFGAECQVPFHYFCRKFTALRAMFFLEITCRICPQAHLFACKKNKAQRRYPIISNI